MRHSRTAALRLITGIGLCAVYLGIAAFTAGRQRRSTVRP